MENRSAPNGPIIPSLIYTDVAKALEWLCRVFGFTERLRAMGAEGRITHAQVAIGQGGAMLGEARVGTGGEVADAVEYRPPRPNESSQTLLVRVPDVDQHYEQVRQRGATILQTPADYPYGERQYVAADLEGYRWCFSQAVADVSPTDWGAQVGTIQGALELLPRPRFCYLEIPSADIEKSVAFYEGTFGWNIRHRGTPRPSFDDATGYVSGAFITARQSAREPGLLPYIWVNDMEAVIARAIELGGEIVGHTQLDSPGGEWIATLRDPSGNVIGLYEERTK